jgi:DNA polymerase-1
MTLMCRSDIKYIGQNFNFDIGVLESVFQKRLPCSFDTMLAHHLICQGLPHDLGFLSSVYSDLDCYWLGPNRYTNPLYNCKDVDATFQSKQGLQQALTRYGMTALFNEVMKAADVVYDMTHRGVCFHIPTCRRVVIDYSAKVVQLHEELSKESGVSYFNPDSPKDVAKALYENLGLPKQYLRGKVTTSKKVIEEKFKDVPFVAKMIEYRHLAKMVRTYVPDENLLTILDENHGIFTPDWKMHGTETGRYSCGIHTFPAEMRSVIVPRPGYRLLGADYSQLEFRIDMFRSGDPVGLAIMERGGDIHRETAAFCFKKPAAEITAGERHLAKFVVHGCRYGRGADSVAKQFKVSIAEAEDIINNVLGPFERYLEWRDSRVEFAKTEGFSVNYFNRRRWWIEGVKPTEVYNFDPQSTGHDILMMACNVVRAEKHKHNWDIHQVIDHHDAGYWEIPDTDEAEEFFTAQIKSIMGREYLPGLPIPVDAHTGPNWQALKG